METVLTSFSKEYTVLGCNTDSHCQTENASSICSFQVLMIVEAQSCGQSTEFVAWGNKKQMAKADPSGVPGVAAKHLLPPLPQRKSVHFHALRLRLRWMSVVPNWNELFECMVAIMVRLQ